MLQRACAKIIGRIPGYAATVQYFRHGRTPYEHEFGPPSQPVRMLALSDGSVLLKGTRRIWADDREPGFTRYTRQNPISQRVLDWRKRQRPGTIMSRATFNRIVRRAALAGSDDPRAVAGRAYWRAVVARARKAGVHNPSPGRKMMKPSSIVLILIGIYLWNRGRQQAALGTAQPTPSLSDWVRSRVREGAGVFDF